MARRYLGMSPDEWDAIPWWQQQMYLEGYEWEGLIEPSSGSSDPNVVSQRSYIEPDGTRVTDTTTAQVLDFTPGAFASYGIPETTME